MWSRKDELKELRALLPRQSAEGNKNYSKYEFANVCRTTNELATGPNHYPVRDVNNTLSIDDYGQLKRDFKPFNIQ